MSEEDVADIYTIGHSTRTLEALIEALKAHGVRTLVDIRTVPRSRHVPQFNREELGEALPAAGLTYLHMKELGGWRKGSRPDSPNTGWRSPGFRAYADYMLTAEFEAALSELLALARQGRTAIMCAEAVPVRCHRSLVSDARAQGASHHGCQEVTAAPDDPLRAGGGRPGHLSPACLIHLLSRPSPRGEEGAPV